MRRFVTMASSQTDSNPSGEGTSRLVSGWKKTWWCDSYPLVTRQAISLGCYCSGYFREVTPAQYSNPGMCSSGYSGWQQGDKKCTPAWRPLICLFPYQWKLEDPGMYKLWNSSKTRKTDFWSHLWATGDTILVPAFVDGGPERQCNSVQEHILCW